MMKRQVFWMSHRTCLSAALFLFVCFFGIDSSWENLHKGNNASLELTQLDVSQQTPRNLMTRESSQAWYTVSCVL